MKGKGSVPADHTSRQSVKRQLALSDIFKEQPLLGWEILDIESGLYAELEITIDGITALTSLYMRAIERLNSLQDPREQYFNLKMQKLMAEPYVIRCFNSTHDHKRNALQARRKDLQQKLEKEVERQNHRRVVQQVIVAQEEKERKMMSKVKDLLEQSHRNLQDQIKEMRSSLLSTALVGQTDGTLNSTCSRGSSGRMRGDRVEANSSFELSVGEEEEFREMQRQVQEEEAQQQLSRALQRREVQNILLQ